MKNDAHLEALFNPSSVAIIGASRDERKSGGRFFQSLMRNGFKGSYYAVNPQETEVMGQKAYASVLDIPGEVDLVVITIPAAAMPRVMADCAKKQVKAAVIFSAGFREAGAEGRDLEKKVLEAARPGGVRIIGPNCMGVYNPGHGLNTIVSHIDLPRESGHVSFIGQSGWASENFIIAGSDRGLRLSKVVSAGNQADLCVTDYLRFLGDDPETEFIGAYLEGIPNGQEFLRQARKVAFAKARGDLEGGPDQGRGPGRGLAYGLHGGRRRLMGRGVQAGRDYPGESIRRPGGLRSRLRLSLSAGGESCRSDRGSGWRRRRRFRCLRKRRP